MTLKIAIIIVIKYNVYISIKQYIFSSKHVQLGTIVTMVFGSHNNNADMQSISANLDIFVESIAKIIEIEKYSAILHCISM